MKKTLLSVAIFLSLSLSAFAQDTLWSRTYGGPDVEGCYSAEQTADGGYIVGGCTRSFGAGDDDIYLIKTNSIGITVWSRTYGGSSWDMCQWGRSVQQTTDGGYIAFGSSISFGAGSYDFYLIKIDSNGDTLWGRTYGGSWVDYGRCVQQTIDGGYILVGRTGSFGAGGEDIYLIKISSTGDTLWTRTYGGSENDRCSSVQQTSDGGYILTGLTKSFGAGDWDVYMIKTDSNGDTLWSRVYGDSASDIGASGKQTTDGGYIVAGATESFGVSSEEFYLMKTDPLGNPQWSRTYATSGDGQLSCVEQTADGGYAISGYAYIPGGNPNIYVLRTDSLGNLLWTRTQGDDRLDMGCWLEQTTDGGYIVSGFKSTATAFSEVILTKFDSLGNTCIGEFVSLPSQAVSPIVTSPATVVTSPPTIVTSPATIVTSPATVTTTLCQEPLAGVPSMSQWGLIVLTLLLVASTAFMLKRREKTVRL